MLRSQGLSRSEPGFHTSSLLGRFDFSPEISLPLQFRRMVAFARLWTCTKRITPNASWTGLP